HPEPRHAQGRVAPGPRRHLPRRVAHRRRSRICREAAPGRGSAHSLWLWDAAPAAGTGRLTECCSVVSVSRGPGSLTATATASSGWTGGASRSKTDACVSYPPAEVSWVPAIIRFRTKPFLLSCLGRVRASRTMHCAFWHATAAPLRPLAKGRSASTPL